MLPPRHKLLHRFAGAGSLSGAPASYDARSHTVEAVIATGAAVKRAYGIEVLRISRDAVDLSRLHDGAGIAFLDHHSQAGIDQVLGKITDAWFGNGELL